MTHNADEYRAYLAARDLTERLLLIYASDGHAKEYYKEQAKVELETLINRMKES